MSTIKASSYLVDSDWLSSGYCYLHFAQLWPSFEAFPWREDFHNVFLKSMKQKGLRYLDTALVPNEYTILQLCLVA